MKTLIFILFALLAPITFSQRFVRPVANVSALQALNVNDPTGTNVFINGFSTATDGGQGIFSWYPASTTTADGGTVFASTSGGSGRWLRQYSGPINVRWFGATGNGATDDGSAVTLAVNSSVNKEVFFPPGTYRIGTTLVSKSNSIWTGEGENSILLFNSLNFCVTVSSVTNVTFRNLKFMGPAREGIVISGTANNITVKDCSFTQFNLIPNGTATYTTPIYIGGGSNITIDHNRFWANGHSVTNASLNDTSDILAASGGRVTELTISNNRIEETSVAIPIQLFDCFRIKVRDNFVDQGNFLHAGTGFTTTGYGILVYALTMQCVDVIVSDNVTTNTAGTGIYLTGVNMGNVSGNNVWSAALQQDDASVIAGGVVITDGSYVRAYGNSVVLSGKHGVAMGSGITNGIIANNIVSGATNNGVEIRSGSTVPSSIIVEGNVITNTFYGIHVFPGTNIVITGNNISTAGIGIYGEEINAGSISGNALRECFAGIRIDEGVYNSITDNQIRKVASSSQAVEIASTSTIVANNFVLGYATHILDSGAGSFNLISGMSSDGVSVGRGVPFAKSDLFSTSTFGGPVPALRITTGGGNTANGGSIDWYINDNGGTAVLGSRLVTSLQDGSAGSLDADLVAYTTFNNVSSEAGRITRLGDINATVGFTIAGLAGSGLYIRGNGTRAVFAALNGSDMTAGTVAPARLGSGVTDVTTVLFGDGVWRTYTAGLGGTVTSVALAAPAEFTVSGSPVTGSGTLTFTKATQTTNAIYAGPASGAAAAPTFRGMVAADIPNALIVATDKLVTTGVPGAATFLNGLNEWAVPAGSGGGTVTSVAQTVPAEFAIAGSPVTTAGTLAITKATQTSNTFWAGPVSGAVAQPAFRAVVADDIPNLSVAVDKLIGSGTRDSTTFYRGDGVFGVPPGAGSTSFADPTGTIGLTAANGVSTDATRSDGHAALSQAIVPTWTGLHSFVNSTTNQIKIGWDVTNIGWLWGDSSGNMNLNPTSAEVNIAGILDASAGFQVGDAATSGNILRGNGAAFVSAAMSASDLSTGTVPIGRIGASGAPGATTFLSGDNTWKTAVTQVSMNGLSPLFTVSGVPITTTGTIAPALISQATNLVFASPEGAPGVPSFRRLSKFDMPDGVPFVTATDILNSNATTNYAALTVPAGKTFITLGVDIRIVTHVGTAPGGTFLINMGTTSGGDDIMQSTEISDDSGMNPGNVYVQPINGSNLSVITPALSTVWFGVNDAATEDNSTFVAYLRGYYAP